MKEELKKYFNINIYKLEQEKKELWENKILYYDLLQEIKDKQEEEKEKLIEQYNKQQEERQKKLVSITEKIDALKIEKNIIYNNIIYLFFNNYHSLIINTLNKYNNKNIGEKTKEKINNEIKEELKKDGIFASVYFSFGTYSNDIYKISFTIYKNEEEQKNYSYNNLNFSFELCNYYNEEEKEKYKNYYTYRNEKTGSIIIHNNMLWEDAKNYCYVEDAKKKSKEILKECKKKIEKVNKLIKQATETREQHNKTLNFYKVEEFDNIEIKHQQNLF